jgi:hypothetical protein
MRGTNDGCSGQGADDAHSRASRGAHGDCDEGRADRRVGTRGSGGTHGGAYDSTHNALTGGGGDNLKGGDGRSQGSRSDASGG